MTISVGCAQDVDADALAYLDKLFTYRDKGWLKMDAIAAPLALSSGGIRHVIRFIDMGFLYDRYGLIHLDKQDSDLLTTIREVYTGELEKRGD